MADLDRAAEEPGLAQPGQPGRLAGPFLARAVVPEPQLMQPGSAAARDSVRRWSAGPASRPAAAVVRPWAGRRLGSTQWNAVADTMRSNGPPPAKSSNEDTWNRTAASATFRRAACTIDAPMSMAVSAKPRPASCRVSWPVPQPISSTAAPVGRGVGDHIIDQLIGIALTRKCRTGRRRRRTGFAAALARRVRTGVSRATTYSLAHTAGTRKRTRKPVASSQAEQAEYDPWPIFRAPTTSCSLRRPRCWPSCWTTGTPAARRRSSSTASRWWTSGAGSRTRCGRTHGGGTRSPTSSRSPRP